MYKYGLSLLHKTKTNHLTFSLLQLHNALDLSEDMDSTNPIRQISDPVFRIWTQKTEHIIEDNQPQTSLISLSIHLDSVHHKLWVSSTPRNNKQHIHCKTTDSIFKKGVKVVWQQTFYNDIAAHMVVSSMLPNLDGVDNFDRQCLVAEIVSTIRKILEDRSSRNKGKAVEKFWEMKLEIDITTAYYFIDDHNIVNLNEGKANVENRLTSSDEEGASFI